MFDGKKVNGRERIVVVVQFDNEDGVKVELFVAMRTFDKEDAITGERLFDAVVEELFTDTFLDKVKSVLSDTTAVNTGSKKGINSRLGITSIEKKAEMYIALIVYSMLLNCI